MNRFRRTVTGTVVVVVAALVGLTAAPASAASPGRADGAAALAALKTEITKRIDLRLAALPRFDRDLTAARNLTDAHQATLHDLITADTGGLTTLKAKVAGETTLAALQADARSMVNDYRVFVLVGPKVRLTIANDAEVAATAKLRVTHGSLAALVAAQKARGVDTAAAEQDLADMTAALDKAAADINGQVGTLLGLRAGPDGAALRTAVASVRRAIGTARADLKNAVAEAKHVRDFLKSHAA